MNSALDQIVPALKAKKLRAWENWKKERVGSAPSRTVTDEEIDEAKTNIRNAFGRYHK